MADLIRINGRVIDRESWESIPDARVEAWDTEHGIAYAVGNAVADSDGNFRMEFSEYYLTTIFDGREPQLFFQIWLQEALLGTTENEVIWKYGDGEELIELPIYRFTGENYLLNGMVFDEDSGEPGSGMRVETWDNDGLIQHAISSQLTDTNGNFHLEFAARFLEDLFQGREPFLFFRVFAGDSLVRDTRHQIIWNRYEGKSIIIPFRWEHDRIHTINGTVFNQESGEGISGLRVEIWDAEHQIDYPILTTFTGAYGQFLLSFDEKWIYEIFQGREPSVYFKIFSDDTLLASTEDYLVWNLQWRERVEIGVTSKSPDTVYTVAGHVFDEDNGQGVTGLQVYVRDGHHIVNYAIATATTGSDGRFQASFTESFFRQLFGDHEPFLYFDVFSGPTLLESTEGSVVWTRNTIGELPIPVTVPKEQNYTINGQVTRSSGANVAGLRIEAWDNDHIVGSAIGNTTTGTSGLFQMTFTEAFFDGLFGNHSPNLFFKVFSGTTLLASTEGTILWNINTGETLVAIPLSDSGNPGTTHPGCADTDTTSYSITGAISSSDRASIGGLQVRIVDKGVGQDVLLAQTTTNPCGDYSLAFDASLVTSRGKKRPDLQARVYSNETLIAASEVRYNASGKETLNVTLPADSPALQSEYDTLTLNLRNHYAGTLRNLQETADRQDITYLANKSGWDARAVAMAALADKFGAAVAVDPTFFYALFRAGLAANDQTIYHTDAATLKQIWETAAEQGIIPANRVAYIPEVIDRFQSLSAANLLNGTPQVGISSLGAMLATAGLREDQQAIVASSYAAHRDDPDQFWRDISEIGDDMVSRLQTDGKLAFLTINNAPLMAAVREASGGSSMGDMTRLPDHGFHRASAWAELLEQGIEIPAEIPGETDEERKSNYAEYLAAQIRISYPTSSVAHMVAQRTLPVEQPQQVEGFLAEHKESFQFGIQPLQQYIASNNLDVEPEVVQSLKRIERVYQISQDEQTMTGLLSNDLDSATHVARYDRDTFVESFGDARGGTEKAEKVHDRSMQIHNAVLNIAISYMTAKNGLALGGMPLGADDAGSDGSRQILQPAPMGPGSVNLSPPQGMSLMGMSLMSTTDDVLAYTTLESLFGEMDFCSCDHCRSVLSPAAYMTDLLYFIDQPPPPPLPGSPAPPVPLERAQKVLFDRRPDIQHLPLTCENTNTALPYIDVVNETLEYYIANTVQSFSLTGYVGHDTGTSRSEDLLASPAFVIDSAYATLANQRFPAPLPFHQPLESLRRHFGKFDIPLALSMERLRPHDNLEAGAAPYGWRDILMEELGLSRAEYEILTDSTTVSLWRMYGFASGTTDAAVIAALSNAKKFARRMGLSYEELAAVLRTRFINPSSDLIPKLERLGVSFPMLQALKVNNNTSTDAQFDALLPAGAGALNPAAYGGNIKAWVKDNANYARIMGLIVLADVTSNADPCSFDALELRFSKPMSSPSDTSTRLGAAEFIRILRFIRLWKKTGWSIEQTDAAICALYRADMAPLAATDIDTATELDNGFLTLLPRLGIVVRIMRELNLTPKRDLLSVLALWSPIGTDTAGLYRQMFLNPAVLHQNPVYAEDGYGSFLTNAGIPLADHAESVRAALNLSGEEFDRIFASLGYTPSTPLSIAAVSAMFRRGYLARALRISVQELLLLMNLTGLDPFAVPSLTDPAILRLATIVEDLKELGLKPTSALYLVWNQDLSGQSAPDAARINDFVRSLRDDFSRIEQEFAIADDPDGEIARARMTLVYGTEATNFFFALLNNTFVSGSSYNHFASSFGPAFSAAIDVAAGTYGSTPVSRLSYDSFSKQLSFTGVMDVATRNAIKATATAPAVVAEVNATAPGSLAAFQTLFPAAIDVLYAANNTAVGPFFAQYAELLPLYGAFIASGDPLETRRNALLANFLPSLVSKRKTQQALQRLGDAAGTDRAFAETLVYASPASAGLHVAGNTSRAALEDLLGLEQQGLSAQFYSSDTVGTAPHTPAITTSMTYAASSANALPANTVSPGNAISGVWSGSVEAAESGLYNFIIEADMGATVRLKINGSLVALAQAGTIWSNSAPVTLKGGTLYAFELSVEKVKNTMRLQWETAGSGRGPIPARLLYPATLTSAARDAYLRFLKAGALAEALGLTAAEVARPAVSGASWLNALPVAGNAGTPAALLAPLRELLDYARVKKGIGATGESLLAVLRDPAAATVTPTSSLYTLTGWDQGSLNALVARFVGTVTGLSQPGLLRRLYEAFALVRGMGISASSLIAATTNNPVSATVRDLQAALRARYAPEDWRTVVQPINDAMRSLQRDALVAYILHQMRSSTATEHIDTPDKLFEYFLMDVQMEPCMQTSRIRHAISSIQLFVERCMMNLEPRVSPRSLSARQWEWMKRYRVWEANRKVFLYPENWLEPELRDDKSPFFKEIESELLESDVTEESVTVAMLNYLSKLEEVAKLEPCAFYHIPINPAGRTGEINHVVARTAGAHRKYYYRRREYGYWTSWEHIKLDIEDNPVMPVVWRDRLLLFWLRILKTGPSATSAQDQKPTGGDELDDMNFATPQQTVQAVLCWSEYYNGKWQPAKTSDLEHPISLGEYAPGGASSFDRSSLAIEVGDDWDGLRINVVGGHLHASFLLYNTHSVPLQNYWPNTSAVMINTRRRYIGNYSTALSFYYRESIWSSGLTRNVLNTPLPFSLIPPRHPQPDAWHVPMFYMDNQHVFYVSSTQKEVPIRLYADYGVPISAGTARGGTIPGVVSGTAPAQNAGGLSWRNGAAAGTDAAIYDSGSARQFVTEDANIRLALGSAEQVTYGNVQIGPAGALRNAQG